MLGNNKNRSRLTRQGFRLFGNRRNPQLRELLKRQVSKGISSVRRKSDDAHSQRRKKQRISKNATAAKLKLPKTWSDIHKDSYVLVHQGGLWRYKLRKEMSTPIKEIFSYLMMLLKDHRTFRLEVNLMINGVTKIFLIG